MHMIIIEVCNTTHGGINWGKFMVGRFTSEQWNYVSMVSRRPLLATVGWTAEHIWVGDLQTGEAAIFRPGGLAAADLDKHRVWVCPMFEPFLTWLYKQDLSDLSKLPPLVQLNAESALAGYRRKGPADAQPKSGRNRNSV